MTMVGLLHPGSMGAAIGSQLRDRGVDVLWCPTGRSSTTAARAEAAGLAAADGLQALVAGCSVLLSVCPPGAAEDVAGQVAQHGFSGVYVEANPIAPERVERIAALLPQAVVVDGGIVGSPPRGGKSAWLYLAGPPDATGVVADLFVSTAVRTRVVADRLGPASALKLSYSLFQKSSRALAALAYAAAVEHGVSDELIEIAGRRQGSYLADIDYLPKTIARGWPMPSASDWQVRYATTGPTSTTPE